MSIQDMEMTTYMQTPRGTCWDIVDGETVALKTIEEARAYVDGLRRINRLKTQLSEMDYYTNKYVEGLLTEERWNEIKTARAGIRAEINQIEDSLKTEQGEGNEPDEEDLL